MNDSNSDKIGSVDLSGLYCPVCDYSLTGLPEPRCPECGNPFDAEEQRRKQGDEPVPVGDCLSKWKPRRGFGVVFEAAQAFLTRPKQFSRMLPRRSDPATPIRFGILTHGLTLLIGIGYAICRFEIGFVVVALFAVMFSLLFDLCFATLCFLECRTRPAYAFAGWHEWFWLMQYASFFLLPVFLVMIPFFELVTVPGPDDGDDVYSWIFLELVLLASILVCVVAWVYIGRLVRGRCQGTGSVLVVLFGIPFCACISQVIAGLIAVFFGRLF